MLVRDIAAALSAQVVGDGSLEVERLVHPSAVERPSDLAVALVHEFQHSKLAALHRLVPLYDRTDPARYFAPWRPDPRPMDHDL